LRYHGVKRLSDFERDSFEDAVDECGRAVWVEDVKHGFKGSE
jgi:hypothetical protein